MSADRLFAILGACVVMALAIAVHVAWRLKKEHLTIDEFNDDDQRSQRKGW